MKKILNRHCEKFHVDSKKVILTTSHSNIYGLKFIFYTRIYVFKKPGGKILIDFVEQNLLTNILYIVPQFHLHHITRSMSCEFLCIDINDRALTLHQKLLLYKIRYKSKKNLPVLINSKYSYQRFFDFTKTNLEDELLSYIFNAIEMCIPNINPETQDNYYYVEKAEMLLDLLSKKELNIENCKVKVIALEMYCSERNLNRISQNAFGLNVKAIIDYHLALKATYLLANHYSIKLVSDNLHFSSPTVFCRFFKRVTGFSALTIKRRLIKC